MKPPLSYDIDGDGSISPQDYKLARMYLGVEGQMSESKRSAAISHKFHQVSGMLSDNDIGGNLRARTIMGSLKVHFGAPFVAEYVASL